MLIQKVFHVKKSATETKSRLSDLGLYERQLHGVKRAALVTDGVGEFEFEIGNGFLAAADIGVIAGENPNEVLFHSVKGNVEIAGMVEFYEAKPNLTEIILTIDYSIRAPFYRLLDSMTDSVDRFFNQQLRALESALNEPATVPANEREAYEPAFHAQPHFAH